MKTHLLVIGMIAFIALLFGCENPNGIVQEEKAAHLTYMNWEEGVAYTHLVQAILEDEMGYEVETEAMDVGDAFDSVAAGESDALMEAWLPNLHGHYMDAHEAEVVDIGALIQSAVSGLVVPQYMADEGTTAISHLNTTHVFSALSGEITGIDAGSALMITLENDLMPAYNLDTTNATGYHLVEGTVPDMMDTLAVAIAAQDHIVVTGWQPHSMFGLYDLHMLEQDGEVVWQADDIHVVGRSGINADKPTLVQLLSEMHLTIDEIGDLMVAVMDSPLSTLEAARAWKDENPDVWSDWVPQY